MLIIFTFFYVYNLFYSVYIKVITALSVLPQTEISDIDVSKLLLSGSNEEAEKFDPDKIITKVYSKVSDALNRMMKGEDKKRDGRLFLALALSLSEAESVGKEQASEHTEKFYTHQYQDHGPFYQHQEQWIHT